MNEPLIYIVTNTVNGKVYVGQTRKGLAHRKAGHISRAKAGDRNQSLCVAMREHGIENFRFEELYRCPDLNDLGMMETFFIAAAGSFPNGYNMNFGSGHVSDEACEKLRRINTGRKVTWNRKVWVTRKANVLAGLTKPHKGSRGSANPKAKAYKVRFPDGSEQVILGLNQFCAANRLTKKCLFETLGGDQHHHKGFALLASFNDHPEREYGQVAGNGAGLLSQAA